MIFRVVDDQQYDDDERGLGSTESACSALPPSILINHDESTYAVEVHTMYCIAGCFASEQNANRLSQKLDLLGFDCKILHEGGLYKVSLGQGISEQAINNINIKAKSLNIPTWILK